jgi:hypothetical protein
MDEQTGVRSSETKNMCAVREGEGKKGRKEGSSTRYVPNKSSDEEALLAWGKEKKSISNEKSRKGLD